MLQTNTILSFLQYRLRSRHWSSFHSPYLFRLFTYCCDEKNVFPEFNEIENIRTNLIANTNHIERTDFGAGSRMETLSPERSISSIARHSLSLPFQCRFLFRLMKLVNPVAVIEFGTSLGIATSYLARGNQGSQIITVEGDPILASMAGELFIQQDIKNIRLFNSTFEDFIRMELPQIPTIDLVFLDGNHKSEPLLEYYHALKPFFNSNTIVVVDDINWSTDMRQGWIALTEMPEVTQTVDCYQFGMLFFSGDFLNKENHSIRLPLKAFSHSK